MPARPLAPLVSAPIVALAVVAVGCGPQVRKPNLFDPGNAATQRYNAIFHDPYPMTDVAPDTDSRPRGYAKPVPEALRARGLQPLQTVAPPR